MKPISDFLHTIDRTSYPEETKRTLLSYMSNRDYLEWISSARITDRITGKKVEEICQLDYSDGEYEWTSSEAYLLEKYDLKISDEFVSHVLESKKPPAHAAT